MHPIFRSFLPFLILLLPICGMSQSPTDTTARPIDDIFEFPDLIEDCAHGHICCVSGCHCCTETAVLTFDTLELRLSNSAHLIGYRQEYLTPSLKRWSYGENPLSYVVDTVSDPNALRNYGKRQHYALTIVSPTGEMIVEDPFEHISSHKGYYYIYRNGLMGIMDSNFNWVHVPKFSEEVPQWFYNEESDGLLSVSQNGKYGIMDGTGAILLPFEHDGVQVRGPHAIVQNEGVYLVYHLEKKKFITKTFNDLTVVYESDRKTNYFKIQDDQGYFGILDKKGNKKLNTLYTSIDFNDNKDLWLLKKDNFYGIYREDFSELIPITYDSILITQTILVKRDSLWGVFDYNGNMVVDCELKLAPKSYNGLTLCRNANGQGAGAIRTHLLGETDFIAPTYLLLSPVFPNRKEGKYFCVVLDKNGYGILEANKNELVVPMKYDEVKTKKYFHGTTRNVSHTEIYLRQGDLWALFRDGKKLDFSITNISDEVNKDFQYRPGVRTIIDFWR